ncbi:COG4223 family protein [Halovulum sp. GXIMD14794]
MSKSQNSDENPDKKPGEADQVEDRSDAEGLKEVPEQPEAEASDTDEPDDSALVLSEDAAVDTPEDAEAEKTEGDSSADTDARSDGETVGAALATAPLVKDGSDPVAEAPIYPTETEEDDYGHDTEEEHSRSLASRVLTALVLLLVGGGLALWAAPRVAPHLPSALDPVKVHLLPGESLSQTRIAALEAELGGRIEAIVPGIDAEEATALANRAAGDAEERLAGQLAEVETRLAELDDRMAAIDGASVEGRLSQLETRLEGLSAELSGLSALQTEGLSDEQLAELNQFQAAVEGMRAEVASLADQQGGLAQRIDEVETAVQRRLDEADAEVAAAETQAEQVQSLAVARAAIATIEAALSSGEPYEDALERIRANTDQTLAEGLVSAAPNGVATLVSLRGSFPDAAHQAIRATIRDERQESGLSGRIAGFLESQVASRSLTPQEGDSTDAILSRAEAALAQDNLGAAVEELQALPAPAAAAMGDWIRRAEARVSARSGFAELNAALSAQN